jgi:hypothetical protein
MQVQPGLIRRGDLLSRMPLVTLTHGGSLSPSEAARRDHEDHMGLVDAIAAGDAAAAGKLLRAHLHHVEAELNRQTPPRPAESLAELLGVLPPVRTLATRRRIPATPT